jgi:hypothetical protein
VGDRSWDKGFEFGWMAQHEAIESMPRACFRSFPRRYDGKAEFCDNEFYQPGRIVPFFVHNLSMCPAHFDSQRVTAVMKPIVADWTLMNCETI